jgi:hypothetical protein
MHSPVLLAVRDMKNITMLAKKYAVQTTLVLPMACLVALTGCSSVEGTAGSRSTLNTRVSTYVQANQEKEPTPVDDADVDPGYEWFY